MPDETPQPLNPYSPGAVSEPREHLHANPRPIADRHYQLRLSWTDRAALLRSVVPMRFTVVLSALITLRLMYQYSTELVNHWLRSGFHWPELVDYGLALLWLANGLLLLYLWWLNWHYAERVREVAGGATADASPWVQLHLKTALVGALSIVLDFGYQALSWVYHREYAG